MKLWRGQPENWTFRPTPREVARVQIGLAAVFYAMAWVEYLSPTPPSGSITRMVVSLFGPTGEAWFFAAAGTALLFAGLLKYRKAA
jgi:polyferredoxin